MTIEGRPWRLTAYTGADGTLEPVPDGVEAGASFEDGHVGGRSGCNRFNGTYTLDGERLAIGPLAGTMMACPEPRMTVEAGFHAAVARVAQAVVHGSGMVLLDGDGRVVLEFEEADVTPLEGTEWSATGINNGHGGVESLVAGTNVTALFADDGRVAGSAGCNRWTATFVVAGSTITIGPAAATRRACPEPEGVMTQEAAFLEAISRGTQLRIDGETLALRDDDGALQVSFRAVASADR